MKGFTGIEIILVVVAVIVLVIVALFVVGELEEKPCEDYANYRIENVPARCAEYYGIRR